MVKVLNGGTSVDWLISENWHADQISTRGRFSEPLRSSRVLLLGAGALGSAVGEMLVRSGVRQVTVMDGDHFEVGNLVRHNLMVNDVGDQKARALARHLNQLSPHAQVDSIDVNFPPLSEDDQARVRACDIVLNCTADREVLYHLETFEWDHPVLFVCLSVGRGATRLYFFTAYGSEFLGETLLEMLAPWASVPVPRAHDAVDEQGEQDQDDELPWAGVGCWHPVFPARADDIGMMASVAVKQFQDVIAKGTVEPRLSVFEQQREGGFFQGVKQVVLGVACA
ncbi:MAG: ThiF family adenylyltransferase [Thermaceae bacterium]|nr:ThiF family adenylyltransferase [Thermaceae bacterium]